MGASGCKAARSLSQLEGDSGAASPESAVSLTAGDSPCVWSEEASRAGPGAELTAWVAAATDHAAEGNEPLGAEDAASETERRLIENMPVDREALAELLRNVFVVEPEGGAAASIRGSICEEEEEDKEAAGQLSPPQLLVRASRVLLRKRLSERSAPDVQERPAAAAKARLVRSYSTPEGVALPVGQTPQLPTLLTSRSLLEESTTKGAAAGASKAPAADGSKDRREGLAPPVTPRNRVNFNGAGETTAPAASPQKPLWPAAATVLGKTALAKEGTNPAEQAAQPQGTREDEAAAGGGRSRAPPAVRLPITARDVPADDAQKVIERQRNDIERKPSRVARQAFQDANEAERKRRAHMAAKTRAVQPLRQSSRQRDSKGIGAVVRKPSLQCRALPGVQKPQMSSSRALSR
eukprot:TRINITY_DN5446_c0_g1_i1.p1 TRINITY_DN5446_c0_g1~~TRINITY_DN5446_c0_g1_i1.p1  ORF type:complete len:409 (-),score=87.56 TRINITY_DN5446_c0_g1_i1:115-1341(-)